jgi:hypothetical protein
MASVCHIYSVCSACMPQTKSIIVLVGTSCVRSRASLTERDPELPCI